MQTVRSGTQVTFAIRAKVSILARERPSLPMNKAITALTSLLFITAIVLGQDSVPLGDIARQLRAKKNVAESTSVQPAAKPQSQTPAQLDVSKLDPDNYTTYVRRLFLAENFAELDRLAASERAGKTRFVGGGWRLYTLYLCLSTPEESDPQDADYVAIMKRLERWKDSRQQSITPRVALADAYLNYAWYARGSGTGDEVSENGWQLFQERIESAKKVLAEAYELKEKCPQWYVLMQTIAMADGWDKDHEAALLAKAVSYEPNYYYYYQRHARYLLPQWSGEPGDTEQFAEDSANKIGGKQGDLLYYKIADEVVCSCEDSPKLSWARIQKGYSALKEQYGEGLMMMNKLGFLAIHYQDVQVAQQILAKIGDHPDLKIWGSQAYFEQCRQWASMMSQNHEALDYNAKVTVEFLNKYAKTVTTCVTDAGLSTPSFTVFLQLSDHGSIERVMAAPAINDCVSKKLQAATLTPPPSAHYGIPINVSMTP